jgi:hypothetical protein
MYAKYFILFLMIGTVVSENFEYQFKELSEADLFLKYFTNIFKNTDSAALNKNFERYTKALDANCSVVSFASNKYVDYIDELTNGSSFVKNFAHYGKRDNLGDLLAALDDINDLSGLVSAVEQLLNSLFELLAQIICCVNNALTKCQNQNFAINAGSGAEDFFAQLSGLVKTLLRIVESLLTCLANVLSNNSLLNSFFEPSLNFVSNSLINFAKELDKFDVEFNKDTPPEELKAAFQTIQKFLEFFQKLLRDTSTFMASGTQLIEFSLRISTISIA